MLVYNQILEDYKAAEIAEEYNISEEEAAKMYFENVIEDDDFTEEDIKYSQFVCTMDEIGCDLYIDYGAGYYFAVKSNRMNEKRLRHLVRESLVRKVLSNIK